MFEIAQNFYSVWNHQVVASKCSECYNIQYTLYKTIMLFLESNAVDSTPPSKQPRKRLCVNVTAPTGHFV